MSIKTHCLPFTLIHRVVLCPLILKIKILDYQVLEYIHFGSFVPRSRHVSVIRAFKGWFSKPLRPQDLALKDGHLAQLRRATGYALVSSRHLRRVSLHGASFVGIVRVRDEDAT